MDAGPFNIEELTGPERAALRAASLADLRFLYFGVPAAVFLIALILICEQEFSFHEAFVLAMPIFVLCHSAYERIGFVRLLGRLQAKLGTRSQPERTV